MAHLEEKGGELIAVIELDSGKLARINLSKFNLSGSIRKLLEALLSFANRQRPRTQVSTIRRFTKVVGDALVASGTTELPSTEIGWQTLISGWYEFNFLREDTKQSLQSALSSWNDVVAPILERIQMSGGLIPLGVVIPRGPNSLKCHDTGVHKGKLIGDKSPELVVREIRKLLVGIDLSRTDPQYLDEIRTKLFHRRNYLDGCLQEWWRQIKAHYEYGQALLNSTSWDDVKSELDELKRRPNPGSSDIGMCGRHTIGSSRETMARQLAVFININKGGHSSDQIRASGYLYGITILRLPPDCPAALPGVKRSQRVSWMLGQLSEVDIAVCTALLVMHNPRFTPFAIIEAKIYDRDGKPYLEVGDDIASFRVEKPRAVSMKDSELDSISVDIIASISKMTSYYRTALKKSGSKLANYLFLITNTRGESEITDNSDVLHILKGEIRTTLYKAFPNLPSVLPPGTITLKRIRATEGVLEWFRTGSLQAMRTALGNTSQVVLKHYLPEPLLAAWNTRLIRRFQNLWIAVAAAGEPFLLGVTDFNSIGELNSFIADMLKLHGPTSSNLAVELHAAYSADGVIKRAVDRDDYTKDAEGRLCVNISGDSLYYLYLYQESALNAGLTSEVLESIDANIGLCPKDFLDLASLVRSDVAQRGNPELRAAHELAINRLSRDGNRTNWSRLMVELGTFGARNG